jgi:hypothetical protein
MRPLDELPYVEYADDATGTARIYADVWESEDIDAQNLVTDHAVETPAVVSDHQRPEPIIATIRMVFSEEPIRGDLDVNFKGEVKSFELAIPEYPDNTPILSPAGIAKKVGAGVGAIGAALGLGGDAAPARATALRFGAPPGRLRLVYERLLKLRAEGKLVAVGFSVARLENLAITGVHIARTKESGTGGAIDIAFKQISFATTKTAAAVALPLEPRGQPKSTSTITVSAEDVPEGPKKTAAQALLDKARGA